MTATRKALVMMCCVTAFGASPRLAQAAIPLFNCTVAAHESFPQNSERYDVWLSSVGYLLRTDNGENPVGSGCYDYVCCVSVKRVGAVGVIRSQPPPNGYDYYDISARLEEQSMFDLYPYRYCVVNTILIPGTGDAYGDWIPGWDQIAVDYSASPSVWAHELGHHVGLPHLYSGCENRVMRTGLLDNGTQAAVSPEEAIAFRDHADGLDYSIYSCTTAIGPYLTAIGEDHRIRLQWTEDDRYRDVTYTITRSTTSCWGPYTTVAQVQSHDPLHTADSLNYTFVDTGAQYAVPYYYWLSTPEELISTSGTPNPGTGASISPPQSLSSAVQVSGLAGEVDLSWTPVSGATSYGIYRASFGGLVDTCDSRIQYLGSTTTPSYVDQGLTTSAVPIGYRVRAMSGSVPSGPSNEVMEVVSAVGGGYMYLDTNGNGVHDAGDTVSETGPTVIDVWLRTDRNRAGAYATCSDGGGSSNTMGSYSFVLGAIGGSVAWSGFVNRIPEFTVGLGEYSDGAYYANAKGSGSVFLAAGTYRIASITATPVSGTPYIVVAPSVPSASGFLTSFGSYCTGRDFDNTLKLGVDWFDSDGAGPFDRWHSNGVPLVSGQSDQANPMIAPDGSGGSIVVWEDSRAGSGDKNIYAQRIDASGNPYWKSGGVAICTDGAVQQWPQIASDGAGGAIVAWQDLRNASDGDIYAQRIRADGSVAWPTNGVPICTATYGQQFAVWGYPRQAIVPDESGGAIIAWQDQRAGGFFHGDIYAQRVNSSGAVQWVADGVLICATPELQQMAVTISDGSGGAIIAWEDYRNDPVCTCVGSKDIYAQRVNSVGSAVWTAGGVPVCVAAEDQNALALVGDGMGGAIIAWEDARVSASTRDIYAQRMNGSGSPQWAADGVVVNAASGVQDFASITTDASNGAIIAWRAGLNVGVQRLDSGGVLKWNAAGVGLSASGSVGYPMVTSDGAGGANIVWEDGLSSPRTLRGQRLSRLNGAALWTAGGVSIAPTSVPQAQLVGDGAGGILVAWEGAGASDKDIFAMRIAPGGGSYTTAVPESPGVHPQAALAPLFPNPFNPVVSIQMELEHAAQGRVLIYDVSGRLVRTLVKGIIGAGPTTIRWDGTNEQGESVASGIYYCRLEALGVRLTRKVALVR